MLRFVATCTLAGAIGACGGQGAPHPATALGVASATTDAGPPPIDPGLDASDAAPPAPAIVDARLFESLLAKLDDPPLDGERETLRLAQLFAQIRALADPRASDGLARYLATTPPPRWRTQAALALAELGDLRAVDALAWRLEKDPLALYDAQLEPELRRDDNERVIAARLLAALVEIHPSKRDEIAKAAEGAVLAWADSHATPHANAMRFLGLVGSAKGIAKLRAWADPAGALPKVGATGGFPPGFSTAQSALRYLGAAESTATKRDRAAWALLTKQLERRPKKLDVSWDALERGGKTILGMALQSLARGAADGFAEWGDAKAFPLLVVHAEEPKNSEQSRIEACTALASVGTDADLASLVAKVKASSGADPKKTFLRVCFLEALAYRPIAGVDAELAGLLSASTDEGTKLALALAIGRYGIDGDAIAKLSAMLGDPALRTAAAVALLLGGDERAASDAVAACDGNDADRDALESAYVNAFRYVSERAYDEGHVARWVANARACRADWPKRVLASALRDTEFDRGPGSLTRVVLRARLYADAKGADANKRGAALALLDLLGEEAGAAGVRGRAP